MSIQNMKCPTCGGPSTEYDINKWKCLECQRKFIYEEHKPSNININNTNTYIDNDKVEINNALVYTCSCCGQTKSSLVEPQQKCIICGGSTVNLCLDCYRYLKDSRRYDRRAYCSSCSILSAENDQKRRDKIEQERQFHLQKQQAAEQLGSWSDLWRILLIVLICLSCFSYFINYLSSFRKQQELEHQRKIVHLLAEEQQREAKRIELEKQKSIEAQKELEKQKYIETQKELEELEKQKTAEAQKQQELEKQRESKRIEEERVLHSLEDQMSDLQKRILKTYDSNEYWERQKLLREYGEIKKEYNSLKNPQITKTTSVPSIQKEQKFFNHYYDDVNNDILADKDSNKKTRISGNYFGILNPSTVWGGGIVSIPHHPSLHKQDYHFRNIYHP